MNEVGLSNVFKKIDGGSKKGIAVGKYERTGRSWNDIFKGLIDDVALSSV